MKTRLSSQYPTLVMGEICEFHLSYDLKEMLIFDSKTGKKEIGRLNKENMQILIHSLSRLEEVMKD